MFNIQPEDSSQQESGLGIQYMLTSCIASKCTPACHDQEDAIYSIFRTPVGDPAVQQIATMLRLSRILYKLSCSLTLTLTHNSSLLLFASSAKGSLKGGSKHVSTQPRQCVSSSGPGLGNMSLSRTSRGMKPSFALVPKGSTCYWCAEGFL